MPYRIVWSPDAQNDIESIYNYYVVQSVEVAINLYLGILDEVELFTHNPYIAAIEPLMNGHVRTYRSFVVLKGRYKVIFFVDENNVYITHVWNCRRNPEKLKSRIVE
jgi:plasmid stabilization system protein ParE